jgi:hypothetical protein
VSEPLTAPSDATTSDLSDAPPRTPARVGRRVGVGVLVMIVLAAGFDVLGPRAADTTARGGGYAVVVEYPQIARAGEPAPLVVSITSDTALTDAVQVQFCSSYFEHLDFQSWYPNPSAEASAPGWVVYEFDPPAQGRTLRIALDARVAPGQLGGRDACQVSVLDRGDPAVTASWATWRVP